MFRCEKLHVLYVSKVPVGAVDRDRNSMNLFRPQKPCEFCRPKYAWWFRPVLHLLSAWTLKHRFNVRQITVRGEASLARLAEEFMGQSQKGTLVERIQKLQRFLVERTEQKHGLGHGNDSIPSRIKALRRVIRKELTAADKPLSRERTEELYDELDRVFVAQQLYSYPGQYLLQNPTADRIAETILKLEEDVLEKQNYPAPRQAKVGFGEPIDVRAFLRAEKLNFKTGARPMTELLRRRIQELMCKAEIRTSAPPAVSNLPP